MENNLTRGSGILENFLAELRAKKADSLIPEEKRNGIIVDIGCGNSPYFLLNTAFRKKIGIDKIIKNKQKEIEIIKIDIEKINYLPFKDEKIDVVTFLAVFEHIKRDKLLNVIKEIKRILKKDGIVILTTPNFFTDFILKILAKFKILSHEEIKEHKKLFYKIELVNLLVKGGFDRKKIESGFFELGFNVWFRAKK